MTKSTDRKNLILNLLYFLMVFSLVYLVGIVLYLDLSFIRQILLAFVITMAVKFVIKNTIVLYLSLIIIFIGGLVTNSYITPIYPYFERFIILFNNIYEHIFMGEVIQSENILPFWTLMTVIYSIFTSMVIFRPKQEAFSLLIIYLPLFIYYWYIYVNEAYFALAVFLFAYFVLRGLNSYKKEKLKVEPELRQVFSQISPFWNKTTLIYGILIVLIALVLPKRDDNIRWTWMEDQISSIVPRIEEMRANNTTSRGSGQAGRFHFTTTGFQENPIQLGGPISPSNETVMYVRADGPTYLRGAVRQFYDGRSWASTRLKNLETRHLLETNFSYIDYYDRREYYDEKDIIVQFDNYASNTLFSPYMPIVVNADRGSEISLSKDHIMSLSEGVYDGESYGVKVLQAKPYYQLLDSGIDNRIEDIENLDQYLQVPFDTFNSLSPRTINLKDEIVQGINSDYEKALTIESYLRDNFEYTLDTSVVPDDYEFIDYFLFEEEAGYCTYYATTMAIFLRLEGIPSRYVEGYIAQETLDGEIYEVRQSHAHAWVEAYIEPVGWMTFEPTSAYPLEDREPEIVDEVEDEGDNQENDTVTEENRELGQEITADDNTGIHSDADTSAEDENPQSTRNTILFILGIILLILPIRFLIRIIMYHVDEYRIKKLANEKKILVIYDKILGAIEKLGHPRSIGETHYEYANRIGYKYEELKPLTKIFVKNKYGNVIPSDEEIEKFVDYRKKLERQLKNYLGKIRYYIKKY